MNIVHANGIWSTRHLGIPDLSDPSVAIMLGGFLVTYNAPHISKEKEKSDIETVFLNP